MTTRILLAAVSNHDIHNVNMGRPHSLFLFEMRIRMHRFPHVSATHTFIRYFYEYF